MSTGKEFRAVFDRLREVLARHSEGLACLKNDADEYYLDTKYLMKSEKPLFFGAVQIRKSYVSYHLMPVYVFPELLDDLSPALRRRMQGKSCFNFRTVDETLFKELARLTAAGYERYEQEGYV